MKCQDVRRRMSAYLDSELDGEATFAISEHLRACRACAERFEAEHRAESAMAERLRREPMPAATRARIRAAVLAAAGAPPPGGGPRRRIGWWIFGAAALACALFLAIAGRGGPRSSAPGLVQDFRDMTRSEQAAAWQGEELAAGALVALPGGLRFSAAPGSERHAIRFAGLDEDARRGSFDLRLLCCGRPLLLRVVLVEDVERPGELGGALATDGHATWIEGGLHVGVRRIGRHVAFAVAAHPVEHVLDSVLRS